MPNKKKRKREHPTVKQGGSDSKARKRGKQSTTPERQGDTHPKRQKINNLQESEDLVANARANDDLSTIQGAHDSSTHDIQDEEHRKEKKRKKKKKKKKKEKVKNELDTKKRDSESIPIGTSQDGDNEIETETAAETKEIDETVPLEDVTPDAAEVERYGSESSDRDDEKIDKIVETPIRHHIRFPEEEEEEEDTHEEEDNDDHEEEEDDYEQEEDDDDHEEEDDDYEDDDDDHEEEKGNGVEHIVSPNGSFYPPLKDLPDNEVDVWFKIEQFVKGTNFAEIGNAMNFMKKYSLDKRALSGDHSNVSDNDLGRRKIDLQYRHRWFQKKYNDNLNEKEFWEIVDAAQACSTLQLYFLTLRTKSYKEAKAELKNVIDIVLAQSAKSDLVDYYRLVEKYTTKTKGLLTELASLGQEEANKATTTRNVPKGGTEQRRREASNKELEEFYESIEGKELKDISQFTFFQTFIGDKSSKKKRLLTYLADITKIVEDRYDKKGFRENTFKDGNSKERTRKRNEYNEGVAEALNDLKTIIDPSIFENPGEDRTNITWTSEEPAPGADSAEVHGSQPWLIAMTELVARAIDYSTLEKESSSPTRNKVRSEGMIVGKGGLRRTDASINNQARYDNFLPPSSKQMPPVELKPGSRTSQHILDLILEGTIQAISHLAKKLYYALHLFRVGVNARATCIVANMSGMKVITLSLKNVGTPYVTVDLEQSNWYPFMFKSSYRKWSATRAKDVDANAFQALEEHMYRSENNISDDGMYILQDKEDSSKERKIPMGFVVLAASMLCNSEDLYKLDIDYEKVMDSNNKDIKLGQHIGSGAHAIVFRRYHDPTMNDENGFGNHVIKVSKDGRPLDLYNEAISLKSYKDESCEHVAKWVGEFILDITLCHLKCKVPALIISPKGEALLDILRDSGGTLPNNSANITVSKVITHIGRALKFLHDHFTFHCDVNPANIIVKEDKEKKEDKAVLIDFSIAVHIPGENKRKERIQNQNETENYGDVRKGVWGTPNYVHKEILKKHSSTKWPKKIRQNGTYYKNYDFAGLYFTAAVLQAEGKIPWSPINNLNAPDLEQRYTQRLQVAKKFVKNIKHELTEYPNFCDMDDEDISY